MIATWIRYETLVALTCMVVCGAGASHLLAESESGVIRSWQDHERLIDSYDIVQTRISRFLGKSPELRAATVEASPGLDKVVELNRDRHTRERVVYSRHRQQWKVEKQELRGIDRMMADKALPELQRLALSDDRILLFSNSLPHYVDYGFAEDRGILTVMTLPKNAIRRPPVQLGVRESGFLLRATETSVTEEERDGQRVRVVTAKLPDLTVVYVLSSELDHRVREVEHRASQGARIYQLVLSDYRLVDGIPLPFKSEERQWSLAGQLTRETLVNVESARVNVEPPKTEFIVGIAPHTAVNVFVENRREAFQTGNYEQSVSLDQAPLIGH